MSSSSEDRGRQKNTIEKFDGPMTFGYGIDAIDATRENQSASNAAVNRSEARKGMISER